MEFATSNHGSIVFGTNIPSALIYLTIPGSMPLYAEKSFGSIFIQHFAGAGYSFSQSYYCITEDIQLYVRDNMPWIGFRLMQQGDIRHQYAGGEVYLKMGQYWFAYEKALDCIYELVAGQEYLVFDIKFEASFIEKLHSPHFDAFMKEYLKHDYYFLGASSAQSNVALLDAVELLLRHPAEPAAAGAILSLVGQGAVLPPPVKELPEEKIERIYQARAKIKENIMIHHTISSLARIAHINERDFKKDFVQVFGMPPFQYLQYERISAAMRLLNTTSRGLDVIARQTGFKNASSLIRVFKDRTGLTPLAWKKKNKDRPLATSAGFTPL